MNSLEKTCELWVLKISCKKKEKEKGLSSLDDDIIVAAKTSVDFKSRYVLK